MEPIATYSEVRFDGARTFTLWPDRIVVRGKQTLLSEFECGIDLATLDPKFDSISIRNQTFVAGVWMALLSLITCTILITGLKMSFADVAPGGVLMIGVAGLILSSATFRKVEYLRFKNQAGLMVLDIGRSGKQATQFDSFVDALTKQIRVARGAT